MKPADRVFNILTVLVLGLTAISCLCIGSIALNPLGVFNFIGPATDPAPLSVPTVSAADNATATSPVFPTFPPEWTATITSTVTEEVLPSETPAPTETVAAPSSGTRTPFPSPVGPTSTTVPTERPTPTNTLPPAPNTATPGSYPGAPSTNTPVPTPQAYP